MQFPKIIIVVALIQILSSKGVTHSEGTENKDSPNTFICCPDTYIFDDKTLSCVCPTSTPFIDITGTCIACPPPRYFNNVSLTCQECPNIKIFNKAKQQCECPYKFYED